eukprot:3451587-Prymnesium_polylepis.1
MSIFTVSYPPLVPDSRSTIPSLSHEKRRSKKQWATPLFSPACGEAHHARLPDGGPPGEARPWPERQAG